MEEIKKLLDKKSFELLISQIILELENSDFLELSKKMKASPIKYLNLAADKCLPEDMRLEVEDCLVEEGKTGVFTFISEYDLEKILKRFKSIEPKDIEYYRRGMKAILDSILSNYLIDWRKQNPLKKSGSPPIKLYEYTQG